MFCVSIWYGAWSHAQHDGMVHEYEKQARSVWHCTCNKCFYCFSVILVIANLVSCVPELYKLSIWINMNVYSSHGSGDKVL